MFTLETHIPLRHKRGMQTIGARIRDAREKLGLTQQQLADRIGVDQSTVSGWERDDKRRPSRDLMQIVAKSLGRTVPWLEGAAEGLGDKARDWDEDVAEAGRAIRHEEIDENLLADVISMAISNLLKTYGVDLPRNKLDAAAETAASAYQSYYRLRRSA